jgi:hypothetical protein
MVTKMNKNCPLFRCRRHQNQNEKIIKMQTPKELVLDIIQMVLMSGNYQKIKFPKVGGEEIQK